MVDERFDIDVGYRDPDDLPRDDFPDDKPTAAEYEDAPCEFCDGRGWNNHSVVASGEPIGDGNDRLACDECQGAG